MYCELNLQLFIVVENRSCAYETVKDRMPLIVTKIVDFLARHRATMAQEFGSVSVQSSSISVYGYSWIYLLQESENEWKSCISAMDKLRYEIARVE